YWNDMYDSSFGDLFSSEDFPDHPSGSKMIGSLNTPNSYDDRYSSFIRGFISTDQAGTATFNITGDDETLFYLSTDQSKQNLQLIAEIDGWTSDNDHDKYPSQTSNTISLASDTYYYFELYHHEGTGGDHVQVFWKTSWLNNDDWQIIDFQYLNAYGCSNECPSRGTPCNDGNASTTNDIEDGYCNCVGQYPTSNECIGERMKVDAYYYDSIGGSRISDLENSPIFPLMPTRKEQLKGAQGPLQFSSRDQYGSYVQGYLTVPTTGQYDFNITGDNYTEFYLSSDDTEANKEAHFAEIRGGTSVAEHEKYASQTLTNVQLSAGQYYYYEFRHKENSWRDHFLLYWRPSFYDSDHWKRFPSFYLYDYGCDLPCVSLGTPCDDGDPFTDNDQFNEFCECAGTPCAAEDCTEPAAQFVATQSCATTDNLDIRPEASWLSCSPRPNINPLRGSGHWIHYDLGGTYKLRNSKIWNYNAPGVTNRGFKAVAIDYSMDGFNWTQVGIYDWDEAPGSIDYDGFVGPNFGDVAARHILITALDNHGHSQCSGFSKALFSAVRCGPEGTPCDDGDPFTVHDVMTADCDCVGTEVAVNDCAQDYLQLGYSSLPEDNYSARKDVMSANTLSGGRAISFVAGESIVIMPGFTIGGDAELEASIEDCIQNIVGGEVNRALKLRESRKKNKQAPLPPLLSLLGPEEEKGSNQPSYKEIIYRLEVPGEVSLELLDSKHGAIIKLVDRYHENKGTYRKYVPLAMMDIGVTSIRITIEGQETIIEVSDLESDSSGSDDQ
ncbi:MAG: discoidin domain-containing protein, partial [Bacteroidota bacterium]